MNRFLILSAVLAGAAMATPALATDGFVHCEAWSNNPTEVNALAFHNISAGADTDNFGALSYDYYHWVIADPASQQALSKPGHDVRLSRMQYRCAFFATEAALMADIDQSSAAFVARRYTNLRTSWTPPRSAPAAGS